MIKIILRELFAKKPVIVESEPNVIVEVCGKFFMYLYKFICACLLIFSILGLLCHLLFNNSWFLGLTLVSGFLFTGAYLLLRETCRLVLWLKVKHKGICVQARVIRLEDTKGTGKYQPITKFQYYEILNEKSIFIYSPTKVLFKHNLGKVRAVYYAPEESNMIVEKNLMFYLWKFIPGVLAAILYGGLGGWMIYNAIQMLI